MSSGSIITAIIICAISVAIVAVYDSVYDIGALLVAFLVYVAYAIMLQAIISQDLE